MEFETLVHTIDPLYDKSSRILILGSFPSRASRAAQFFYGHTRNRFWPLISRILDADTPVTIEEKKRLMLDNHIALWDTVHSCEIRGSSDASIQNVVANDVSVILSTAQIRAVFTNGTTSTNLYKRYILPVTGVESIPLPSTSPANASMNIEKLFEKWKIIKEYLK